MYGRFSDAKSIMPQMLVDAQHVAYELRRHEDEFQKAMSQAKYRAEKATQGLNSA
jgi:cobalamin biosynthesis Co2+ chelatase CbiK